jgi:hypothetical protein
MVKQIPAFVYGKKMLTTRDTLVKINQFNHDVDVFTSIFDKWRQGIHTYQGGPLYKPIESQFIMNTADDATEHYMTLRDRYRELESDYKGLPEEWQRNLYDELIEARKKMEYLNRVIQQPITAGSAARRGKGAKSLLDRAKKASGIQT